MNHGDTEKISGQRASLRKLTFVKHGNYRMLMATELYIPHWLIHETIAVYVRPPLNVACSARRFFTADITLRFPARNRFLTHQQVFFK